MRTAGRSTLLPALLVIAAGCSSTADFPEPERTSALEAPVLGKTAIKGDALPTKTVVFTYDDGPDEHTLELAQYLKDNDIRATFFINGRRICKTMDPTGKCLVPMDTRACDDGMSQDPVAAPKYYPE